MKKLLMNTLVLASVVCIAACATGTSYMDVYNKYRAEGLSHPEAIKSADFYCLNNPCVWGKSR